MGHAGFQLSSTAEKICDLVKKILPIIAAICHVGQFKFCAPITADSTPPGPVYNYEKLD